MPALIFCFALEGRWLLDHTAGGALGSLVGQINPSGVRWGIRSYHPVLMLGAFGQSARSTKRAAHLANCANPILTIT